jgi:hypothetical protein
MVVFESLYFSSIIFLNLDKKGKDTSEKARKGRQRKKGEREINHKNGKISFGICISDQNLSSCLYVAVQYLLICAFHSALTFCLCFSQNCFFCAHYLTLTKRDSLSDLLGSYMVE